MEKVLEEVKEYFEDWGDDEVYACLIAALCPTSLCGSSMSGTQKPCNLSKMTQRIKIWRDPLIKCNCMKNITVEVGDYVFEYGYKNMIGYGTMKSYTVKKKDKGEIVFKYAYNPKGAQYDDYILTEDFPNWLPLLQKAAILTLREVLKDRKPKPKGSKGYPCQKLIEKFACFVG